jgi:hypothetical protein
VADYSYSYRKKKWLSFREDCLRHAGYKCERCERSDVILQVHHPEYVSGLEPWEYSIEFCEVVCRRCHAEIHGKIKPSGGWIILHSDLDDNEPSDAIPCEHCGLDITWHFTIYHPDWGEIVVGSECAENLSLGPEIKALKSFRRRLQTFIVSPRWRPTPKGVRISHDDHSVLVYRQGKNYRLKIDDDWGELTFASENEAKERAFRKIEQMNSKCRTRSRS